MLLLMLIDPLIQLWHFYCWLQFYFSGQCCLSYMAGWAVAIIFSLQFGVFVASSAVGTISFCKCLNARAKVWHLVLGFIVH